jgi:hypothetical protein
VAAPPPPPAEEKKPVGEQDMLAQFLLDNLQ